MAERLITRVTCGAMAVARWRPGRRGCRRLLQFGYVTDQTIPEIQTLLQFIARAR